jgi:hypothetical protein
MRSAVPIRLRLNARAFTIVDQAPRQRLGRVDEDELLALHVDRVGDEAADGRGNDATQASRMAAQRSWPSTTHPGFSSSAQSGSTGITSVPPVRNPAHRLPRARSKRGRRRPPPARWAPGRRPTPGTCGSSARGRGPRDAGSPRSRPRRAARPVVPPAPSCRRPRGFDRTIDRMPGGNVELRAWRRLVVTRRRIAGDPPPRHRRCGQRAPSARGVRDGIPARSRRLRSGGTAMSLRLRCPRQRS